MESKCSEETKLPKHMERPILGFGDGGLSSPPFAGVQSPGSGWQHSLSGCGQRAETMAFLRLRFFQASQEEKNLLQYWKM